MVMTVGNCVFSFKGIEGLLKYIEEARHLVKMDALSFLMRKVGGYSESGIEDDVTIVCVDLPPFSQPFS